MKANFMTHIATHFFLTMSL